MPYRPSNPSWTTKERKAVPKDPLGGSHGDPPWDPPRGPPGRHPEGHPRGHPEGHPGGQPRGHRGEHVGGLKGEEELEATQGGAPAGTSRGTPRAPPWGLLPGSPPGTSLEYVPRGSPMGICPPGLSPWVSPEVPLGVSLGVCYHTTYALPSLANPCGILQRAVPTVKASARSTSTRAPLASRALGPLIPSKNEKETGRTVKTSSQQLRYNLSTFRRGGLVKGWL